MCGLSRRFGAAVAGSRRSEMHLTSEALKAIEAQKRILEFSKVAYAGRPEGRGDAPSRTCADVARSKGNASANPSANSSIKLASHVSAAAVETHSGIQGPEEDEDANPTRSEEIDYESLKKHIWRLEKTLTKRVQRHSTELAAVQAQEVLIAEQQSKLHELQCKAAETRAQVGDYKATIADFTQRQALLAAERARVKLADFLAVELPCEVVQYARRCVSDIVDGIGDYDHQLLAVQELFANLAAAIDDLRNPTATDPKQQTLPAVVAKQAAQSTVQCFSIASAAVTWRLGKRCSYDP